MVDALDLAQRLIRCPSVTPNEGGALDLLQAELTALGFACTRKIFQREGSEAVDNLFARRGTTRPVLAFAGHTDVVPTGPESAWSEAPFSGVVRDGLLYGRGAADMKGGIAAFVAATAAYLAAKPDPAGSIALLITGDEEGIAVNGTAPLLEWMAGEGIELDGCVVGEPTNPSVLGEMMKIGRRGSLTGTLTVLGTQGHVAYPQRADNPVPRMIDAVDALNEEALDSGTEMFQPSNLEITSLATDTNTSNVIPGEARAIFNVRFNDLHTGEKLAQRLTALIARHAGQHRLEIVIGGEPFRTEPGRLSALLAESVTAVTGRTPELSTTGGTSDARFIARYCPVIEFGLVGQTMHKIDENIAVADLEALTLIYQGLLERWFA